MVQPVTRALSSQSSAHGTPQLGGEAGACSGSNSLDSQILSIGSDDGILSHVARKRKRAQEHSPHRAAQDTTMFRRAAPGTPSSLARLDMSQVSAPLFDDPSEIPGTLPADSCSQAPTASRHRPRNSWATLLSENNHYPNVDLHDNCRYVSCYVFSIMLGFLSGC